MNEQQSSALSAFQAHCQEIYICYSVAAIGMANQADKISQHNPDPSKRIFVGTGHPSKGNFQGAMKIGKYLDCSTRSGDFSSTIAKSFVTTIYSLWDEHYRHLVAEDVSVTAAQLKSGLMGDLRKVRHCIVHSKSVVHNQLAHLEELKWKLDPGTTLKISDEMFRVLMDQINSIRVRIERLPDQDHDI